MEMWPAMPAWPVVVDAGRAHRGTVNAGVGTDLHMVADLHIADLRDFQVLAVLLGKAEAVSTDDRPRMQDAVSANVAVLIDLDPGVQCRAGADLHAGADNGLRVETHTVADFRPVTDAHELADIDVLPDFCGRGDAGLVGNARLARFVLLVEIQELREGEVGVGHLNKRTGNFLFGHKVLVDNGRRSFCSI